MTDAATPKMRRPDVTSVVERLRTRGDMRRAMSRKFIASTAMESCHHAAWNATIGASRPSQGQELSSWVGGTGRTPSRVAITTGKPRGEHQAFPLDPQYLARAPHMPLASTCRDKQWPETRARVVCVHGDICFADARGTQVRPGVDQELPPPSWKPLGGLIFLHTGWDSRGGGMHAPGTRVSVPGPVPRT